MARAGNSVNGRSDRSDRTRGTPSVPNAPPRPRLSGGAPATAVAWRNGRLERQPYRRAFSEGSGAAPLAELGLGVPREDAPAPSSGGGARATANGQRNGAAERLRSVGLHEGSGGCASPAGGPGLAPASHCNQHDRAGGMPGLRLAEALPSHYSPARLHTKECPWQRQIQRQSRTASPPGCG